jgi:hypothetical protein
LFDFNYLSLSNIFIFIKQLLNLWYLTMIQENKLTTSHVFTKALN